jgi:predicted sulfurtransferase
VFDDRMGTEFSDHAKVIGACIHCAGPTSNYENCALKTCNELVLICDTCLTDETKRFHTVECYKTAVAATSA